MINTSPRLADRNPLAPPDFMAAVRLILLFVCGWLTPCVVFADTPMFSRPTSLWTLLTQLSHAVPFTKEKIEAHFGAPLRQTSRNDYFTMYGGGGTKLEHGLVVSSIDLRVRHDGQPHPGFLVLALTGGCVSVTDVRQHFPRVTVVQTPRGRSVNEQTYIASDEPWGEVSFGFPVSNPGCLTTVVLNPKP